MSTDNSNSSRLPEPKKDLFWHVCLLWAWIVMAMRFFTGQDPFNGDSS